MAHKRKVAPKGVIKAQVKISPNAPLIRLKDLYGSKKIDRVTYQELLRKNGNDPNYKIRWSEGA
jgi:hypothetical protein